MLKVLLVITLSILAPMAAKAKPQKTIGSSSSAAAPSNPPAQAGLPKSGPVKEPAETGREQSNRDERGTEKSPLVVKTQNSPKAQEEAEQDADYIQHRASDDRMFRVAVWSIVIGVAQTAALVVTFLIIAYVAVRQLRAYVYPEIKGTQGI